MKTVILILVFFLVYITSVNAVDINSCGVLDQEGETYILQNDIETEETCFEITADDITLDCNGHSITGLGRWDNGVVAGGNRITITNCEITGFEEGIVLWDETEIVNNNLHGNGDGINLRGYSNIIRDNIINGNHEGVYSEGTNSNIIRDNIINGNNIGINLYWGSQSNIIIGNTINRNGEEGIFLSDDGSNIIADNTINENGVGVYLNSYANIITDNIANNNDYGIYFYWSENNNIVSNTFCYNNEVDIIIDEEGENNEFLYNQFDTIEGLELEGMPCDIESQEIQLNQGWNLISSYLIPYFTDIEAIFGKLARQGILVIVKDENGNFYKPDFNFDNIHTWNSQKGYQVKVTEDTQLTIKGEEHVAPVIQLHEGWNFMGYPLTEARDMNDIIENVLAPLVENNVLNILKNGQGNFYIPRYNFNNIREMIPGEGYLVKVSEDGVIDFRE